MQVVPDPTAGRSRGIAGEKRKDPFTALAGAEPLPQYQQA